MIKNYSIDSLRKAVFERELQDNLLLLSPEEVDEETLIVIEYLKKQVAEIKKEYG